MGQHDLAGNGADFAMVFQLETICGTNAGSKANDGGASRWCSFPHAGGFPHCRASWPQISIEKVVFNSLNKAASSFFRGALLDARAV
jgi:hypothetical protein